MKLRPLPPIAADLLDTVLAPPRLVAHLTLVHDVAAHLVPAFQRAFPALVVDEGAVFFGAATHDIGKALAPSELSEPGKTHERLGEDLLLRHGIVPSLACFARTHGLPVEDDALTNEDLLVILADTVWKGRRDGRLEDVITKALTRSGTPAWQAFDRLDAILTNAASGADARLAWQQRHPLR
jgi:hypothetical protein